MACPPDSIILFVFVLFCMSTTSADVVSIDITTCNNELCGTVNKIEVTLWFNFTIYQCIYSPTSIAHNYSITNLTVIGSSDCDPETKIMIDNTGNEDPKDGTMMDSIAIHTASGAWYGISGRCVDDALLETQSWLKTGYYGATMDELGCISGVSNVWMSIDDEKGDSRPPKQIFYFDTTRANEFINNASWSDGTNVVPQIASCDPTINPTVNPSHLTTLVLYSSTRPPDFTIKPSVDIIAPTLKPTTIATPTAFPNIVPSFVPSHSPTNYSITTSMNSMTSTIIDTPYSSVDSVRPPDFTKKPPVDIIAVGLLIFIGVLLMLIIYVLILLIRRRKQSPAAKTSSKCGNRPHQIVEIDDTKRDNAHDLQMVNAKKDNQRVEYVPGYVPHVEGATNGIQPDEFIVDGNGENNTTAGHEQKNVDATSIQSTAVNRKKEGSICNDVIQENGTISVDIDETDNYTRGRY